MDEDQEEQDGVDNDDQSPLKHAIESQLNPDEDDQTDDTEEEPANSS